MPFIITSDADSRDTVVLIKFLSLSVLHVIIIIEQDILSFFLKLFLTFFYILDI